MTADRLETLRYLNAVNGGLTRAQAEELLDAVKLQRGCITPEAFAAMPEVARDAWLKGTAYHSIALPSPDGAA